MKTHKQIFVSSYTREYEGIKSGLQFLSLFLRVLIKAVSSSKSKVSGDFCFEVVGVVGVVGKSFLKALLNRIKDSKKREIAKRSMSSNRLKSRFTFK